MNAQRSQLEQFCYGGVIFFFNSLYGRVTFSFLHVAKLMGGVRECLSMIDSGENVVKALLHITHCSFIASSDGLSNVPSQHWWALLGFVLVCMFWQGNVQRYFSHSKASFGRRVTPRPSASACFAAWYSSRPWSTQAVGFKWSSLAPTQDVWKGCVCQALHFSCVLATCPSSGLLRGESSGSGHCHPLTHCFARGLKALLFSPSAGVLLWRSFLLSCLSPLLLCHCVLVVLLCDGWHASFVTPLTLMFTAALKASVGVGCQYEWLLPLLNHKLFKLTDVWEFGGFLCPLVSGDDSQHVILITD